MKELNPNQQAALADYLRLSAELREALEAKYDLEKRINTLRHQLKFSEQVLKDSGLFEEIKTE